MGVSSLSFSVQMEETPAQRKQRLMAIRAAAREAEGGDDDNPTKRTRLEDQEVREPVKLQFRNYKPISDELAEIMIETQPAKPVLLDIEGSKKSALAKATNGDVVQLVDRSELEELEIASMAAQDLAQLLPKNATWDLERMIEPKLQLLNSRTERALVELLREKLRQNPEGIVVEQE
eukprot:Amastigsp_a193848_11.p1 type:complete len:177 gc:universal Amastigsp_a193848_11:1-531(+)